MADFDFQVIVNSLPFLTRGLAFSFFLTFVAMAGGMVLGLVLAVIRLSPFKPAATLAALYTNGFRAIPLILVIFWFYFLVPLVLARPVGALQSVLVAFVMFEAAYYSEIIRAGLQSVSKGQWQASYATGMSYLATLRIVILPQAFKAMAPLMVTQGVILFQDTALVYVVTLRDFMTSASIVANNENRLVEMYVFAALVYYVICTLGGFLASRLQRHAGPLANRPH